MAWIESHQGLARHIKTKRLARKLGVTIPAVIGHLHLLWWWAMDNLPDGSLSMVEYEDIADEMMWNEDPEKLISALIESGFIDETDEGLVIHDWQDYIGRLLEKRKQDVERKRKNREKSKGQPTEEQGMSDGSPAGQDVEASRDGARNRTVPNRTKPKIKNKINYAEFVSLTESEYGELVAKYGKEFTDECIRALDNYKGAKGTKYKSDYRAMLNWVVERVTEDRRKRVVSFGKPQDKQGAAVPDVADSMRISEEMERLKKEKMKRLEAQGGSGGNERTPNTA